MSGSCASRFTTNWARTPTKYVAIGIVGISNFGGSGGYMEGVADYPSQQSVTRYRSDFYYATDWSNSIGVVGGGLYISGAYAKCLATLSA